MAYDTFSHDLARIFIKVLWDEYWKETVNCKHGPEWWNFHLAPNNHYCCVSFLHPSLFKLQMTQVSGWSISIYVAECKNINGCEIQIDEGSFLFDITQISTQYRIRFSSVAFATYIIVWYCSGIHKLLLYKMHINFLSQRFRFCLRVS